LPEVEVKAYKYIIPIKASVTVIDSDFHRKGDVNWDGVIDGTDLDLIREAYGSSPGDPNWNPDADLNGDNFVDVMDISICAGNQGLLAPVYETPFTVTVTPGKCIMIARHRAQEIKAEFMVSGTKVTFIFTLLGILNRAIITV